MDVRALSPDFAVLCRQMTPDDVADMAAAGYVRIINSRPDDEVGPQQSGAMIEAACRAASIAYVAVPFHPGRITSEMIEGFAAAINEPGPSLGYCRSGTRSATLWALAQAGQMPVDAILSAARAAGYDLTKIHEMIEAMAEVRD